MKKILLSLIILSTVLVSCKKFLDTVPTDNLLPTEYYDTEAKLMNALAGVYYPLSTDRLYGNLLSCEYNTSDEAFYQRNTQTSGVGVNNFDYADANINGLWQQCYLGIERANTLIANINIATVSDAKRNTILGEALFMRGFYHFLLVSNYGAVPLKTSPTKSPLAEDVQLPRTSIKEVYVQILSDMTKAEGLTSKIADLGFSGRVSKTTVEGILARVCLTMAGAPLNDVAKYADAKSWALKVMQSGEQKLNSSYKQVFINMAQDQYDVKESMWEVEFKSNGADGLGSAGRVGSLGGIQNSNITVIGQRIGYSYGFLHGTGRFYNLYQAGDLRRDWNLAQFNYTVLTDKYLYNYYSNTSFYSHDVAKFRREAYVLEAKNQNTTPINYPILRYSDVLLMFAEAENYLNGPTAAAYDAINQVRRRGFGVDASTANVTLNVVSLISAPAGTNTGYTISQNMPITLTGGGGSGATAEAIISTAGKVTAIAVLNPGNGYTLAPTVTVGKLWTANTDYAVGNQVTNGNNVYTVTVAGTSTAIGPTQASGASTAAITGAVFTFAGGRATATATIATTVVDLSGLVKLTFQQAIEDERARELCFEALRRPDLMRWGKYVTTMNEVGDEIRANGGGFSYGGLGGTNVSPKYLLFPIPSSEITVNKLATQNPGW